DIYKRFADEKNVSIAYTIDTHLHADHISGGRRLAEETGGMYHLPPKDAEEVTFDYAPLEEGTDIVVGSTTIKVQPLYSPGHTIGSTSLIIDNQDRKSTRLNSSHVSISYAVFCLKKKNNNSPS